jgi:cytochrome oxidase Cu insertion factor (SCO1/SenC/PrrC family)
VASAWVIFAASAVAAAAPTSGPALFDMQLSFRDEHDAPESLSHWRGKTVLLTMAYSTCREVCSYTLHRLEELQDSADRAGTPIEVVVVSYDPTADSPASWSRYRRKHRLSRGNWHFLTGTPAITRQFAEAIQFRYWSYDEHVLHDFRILMIRPDGEIAGSLDWETRNRDFFADAINNGTPDKQGSYP